MTHDNSLASPVNPDGLSRCPRCSGSGRIKYTRPGGWLSEPCTSCSGGGRVDAATADTLRVLMRHAEAALGPVDGPCCSPAESNPCTSCLAPDLSPDDVAWMPPSDEDEAFRLAWIRDHDARVLSERLAADEDEAYRAMERDRDDARLAAGVFAALKAEGFQEMLAGLSNAFSDHGRADVRFVGVKIGGLYDQARLLLEAKSGEQFDERLACHLDSIAAAHAAF